MRAIVPMPLESIIQMLCAVNFMLSGERLELKDVTIYDSEQRGADIESAVPYGGGLHPARGAAARRWDH